MTTFKTLLLATALGVAGLSSVSAGAATYVATDNYVTSVNGAPVVVAAPTRVVGGHTVASQSMIAVGTRKVGHVGGRPYPIEASHAERTTVRATPHGLVERTVVTDAGRGPVNVNSSGGNYYTDTDGSYYADPAFNVNVYTTGSFND